MTLIEKINKEIYPRFASFLRFEKKAKIISVDFNKPWWKIIASQKWLFGINFLSYSLKIGFQSLLPFFIGLIISAAAWISLLWLLIAWITIQIINTFAIYYYMLAVSTSVYSVHYSAHKFFLSVDPIFHSTRSSGKIITKINRASDAYEELMDILLLDGVQIIVGTSSVAVVLFSFDWQLGLVAGVSIFIIGIVSVLTKAMISKGLEKRWIKDEDSLKAASIENLQQVSLIRASFASPEQDKKLTKRNLQMIVTSSTIWYIYSFTDFIVQIIYIFSIGLLGWLTIDLINQGTLEPIVAISLIMTYIAASSEIINVGGRIRRIIERYTRIQDLFKYIRNFGKQTFPVLTTSNNNENDTNQDYKPASIKIANLSFKYENGTEIFNNHSLTLKQDTTQTNHLYGIIGPSGVGKTTFLSILGGQLRPPQGQIIVDGQDIYQLDDLARRQILAVQMQTASNLRGELRYNLLFGLPGNEELDSFLELDPSKPDYEELLELIKAEKALSESQRIYTDAELIQVLQKVGLWTMFKDKDGLDTLIGEGGLNLSGGQRQRLNFAGLYLRARYFKPSVILIDEPTSSLDEISEKAVTQMIRELSRTGLTIVIAHRLKTLKEAEGILDFSLNKTNQNMCFENHSQLMQKSDYYRKLIMGVEQLDE